MRRVRWMIVVVGLVLLAAACGDDGDAETAPADPPEDDIADDEPSDDDEMADDETADEEVAEEPEEGGADGDPGQNTFSIDGTTYEITIDTCFGVPGTELEVIASIRGAPDSTAYAYIYMTEEGAPLTLSAFEVADAAQGLDWSNPTGEGATDLTMTSGQITGSVPVTSADGATAAAAFNFVCPGR